MCPHTSECLRPGVGAGLSDLTVESAGLVPTSQMTELWLGRGTWASWGGAALQALGWGTAELESTGRNPAQHRPLPLTTAGLSTQGPSPGGLDTSHPVPRE